VHPRRQMLGGDSEGDTGSDHGGRCPCHLHRIRLGRVGSVDVWVIGVSDGMVTTRRVWLDRARRPLPTQLVRTLTVRLAMGSGRAPTFPSSGSSRCGPRIRGPDRADHDGRDRVRTRGAVDGGDRLSRTAMADGSLTLDG
jgi:hypothetical protein